jgi:hypothetical protein
VTFGAAFAMIDTNEENQEIMDLLSLVIDKQKLALKPMNGLCSEGLKKDEFERMGICYVDIFNLLEQRGSFWTPCDILYEMCKHNLNKRNFYEKKAKVHKMSFEQITWLMCGRALRALPSYIREYQLKNELQIAFPKATFFQDEDLDRKFHCDIKMTLDDHDYFFWSFISSTRSVYQFIDKFKANRYGHIADGSHVLCPFNRKEEGLASYKGWAFYSSRYINEIKTAIYQKEHLDYDNVICDAEFIFNRFKRPVVVNKISTRTTAKAS